MHSVRQKRTFLSLLLLFWGSVLISAAPYSERFISVHDSLPDSISVTTPLRSITTVADTTVSVDSTTVNDTIPATSVNDTIPATTATPVAIPPKASSPLTDRVTGSQEGFMTYDIKNDKLTLYKNAKVKYTEMQIDAEFIEFDQNDNNVTAYGTIDTMTNEYIRPVFTENETTYDLDSVRYNIETAKALIYGGHTKEGEGTISGGVVKKMPDDVMHMRGGRYTTCDADCPHFYLQMTRGTIEPDKKIVFGPAYMVIEDVPIYFLGLPFGFFPQQGDRNSGVIIPQVGEEVVKGFFLREGGYYFVFNDYLDATVTAGIYTLGSWQMGLNTNYRKRYKFSGGINFDFAKDIFGEKGAADYVNQQNMRIQWTHQQDPKFKPSSTFSASVNYSSSKYNQYNATNMNDYLTAQTSSSIAYSKNWTGTPFSMVMNASHSQNMRDSSMSLTFPTMIFNVSRINPFKRKNAVGKERWYEKVSFTFNTNFSNSASSFKQDELLKEEMFDKMRFGFEHQLPVSASFNLFQYLNITPGVNYTERWYFRKVHKDWNSETERVETTDTTSGFYRVYNYSANVSMNTRLYGEYTFGRKGAVKMRHVMSPNLSLSFNPNFGKDKYGYYETIQSDKHGGTMRYSPFENERYGVPGANENLFLGFGVGNTLEMKVPSAKDTSGFRKLKILEAFGINSSYDFLADSLNLSSFSVNLRTTIVKGVSLNVNASFDPYQVNAEGQRINRFVIQDGKGLARLTSLTTGFSYGFSSKVRSGDADKGVAASNNPDNNNNAAINNAMNSAQQDGFFNQTENQYTNALQRAQLLANQYYDFSIPWSVSFNYSFGWNRPRNEITRLQTVSFNGSMNLTQKWAVEFGAGYDFVQKKLTPGTVMIRRDLHCLQATFSWVPIGFRQSWTFTIRAKSSMLADLIKYKKSNSFIDNYYNY